MKPRSRRLGPLLVLVAIVLGALLSLVLPAVVRERVEEELAASGFPDARFEVKKVGLRGVTLADVALAPDLAIEEIAIELDLLSLQPEAMTLKGARVSGELSSLGESSAVRLLARQGGPRGAAPASIRLERASAVITTPEGPIRVDVAGEVRPAEGRARLSVRSPLGEHQLVVRSREAEGAALVAIEGDGGGDAIDLSARIEPDAVALRGRAVLASGARGWAEHRMESAGARLDGSVRLDGGRVSALDLRGSARALVVDGLALGDTTLDAQREGDALVWSASAHGEGGLALAADGALERDPSRWSAAFAWEVTGPIPADTAERAAPFLALEGPVQVELTGRARQEGARWVLESIRGSAAVDRLGIPDAELVFEGVHAELAGRAILAGERVEVEVEGGSRLLARGTHLDALHIDGLDAAPVLTVLHVAGHGGASIRVDARAPIATRMTRLSVGEGPSALAFEDVTMALHPQGGTPIGTSAGDRVDLAARMEASAPRVAGILGGRGVRARATIDVAVEGDADPRVAIPLDVRAARIDEAESEVSLATAHIRLPLLWDRGEVSADGRIRAEQIAWRAIPIGGAAGAVRIAEDTLRLDWRAAPLSLAARIGLEEGDGAVVIRAPKTTVRARDPIAQVIAALTDLSIEGPIAGEVRLDLQAPERGDARLVLDGASVREVGGAGAAQGVRGTLALTHLDPLESARPAPVTWERLELGGVKLEAGSAALAFARPGDVLVRDMRVALAGGQVEVAPVRFAWEAPDLALDLRVRGIELAQVLSAATSGRITGDGKLDGRIALRVKLGDDRRIELGDGRLASRGPGVLRVQMNAEDPDSSPKLGDLLDGTYIRRRVLAAMEDFEYRRLTMNVSDEGTSRVRARVVGRGKRMPQELDMTLNFRGVQPLLDHAVRFWPDGAEASIEVGGQ